jgi:hypothetical protein
MSEEEIERIADLLFQKFLEREEKYLEEEDISGKWTSDGSPGIWYTYNFSYSDDKKSSKELLTQRLGALNIEKQQLIAEEKYEELIKLQETIDEIKEELKKYKD